MAGLVPAIQVFIASRSWRPGCREQARAWRGRRGVAAKARTRNPERAG